MELRRPEVVNPAEPGAAYRPSWSGHEGFLSPEHEAIHEATKDLPGWQDVADSQKLYEMAWHSGGVILEVGVFGGRSAVVEMRGALRAAAERESPPPQYYGVDIDPGFFGRSIASVEGAGVAERCLFYHGDLARFMRDIPITPTMVFLDGDHRYAGVWADLKRLSVLLAPGTPMLCHDYGGIEGVRRAVDEWVAEGSYEAMGRFAGSILVRATGKWSGAKRARGLTEECFQAVRSSLSALYSAAAPAGIRRGRHHTPVREITRAARFDARGMSGARLMSGRGPWPYAADPRAARVPATMPGGRPWPRITVVTPSFNQGPYIEETLLSVLNQGYPNLEYLVIDGGSTDMTLSVVEHYKDRLAHFESVVDRGQADAINKGFARATGDILAWVNSDDMLAPGALAAAALALDRSGADMVAGEVHIYRDGRLAQRHMTSCGDGPLPLDELLDIDHCWMPGQFFYQPEVLFTRAIWEKAGGRLDLSLYHSLDYELWVRMAEAGATLHVIGRPIALFRAHPEQKTAGSVAGGFRAELPRVREAILERTGRAPVSHGVDGVRQRLRVALVNDVGFSYGAGIAHRRVAAALSAAGHTVRAFAALSTEPWREAAQVSEGDVLSRLEEWKPDLVIVGNLHGAGLESSLLARIGGRFETAFLMHDLWVLTGRCAYAGRCTRYLTGCGASCTCAPGHPELAKELVAPAWEQKRRVLGGTRSLSLWANSGWAQKKAEEALGAPEPGPSHATGEPECGEAVPTEERGPGRRSPGLATVSFGLDLEVFRPRDRMECREALGLARDRFIIMSSASSLADPRKGLSHLASALERLRLRDVLVVCVGWFRPGEQVPIPGMRAMGYMKEAKELATLYAAADLFVGPSLEEAFGQVFIEAAACGTPSVGYPVGGVPEAIADGVSGRVADLVNPESLADAIDELYRDPALRRDMGAWGRIWAEGRFSMSASYHSLHRALWDTGAAARLKLSRKIDLVLSPGEPEEPVLVAAGEHGWRGLANFDPWEGPYRDRNIPRGRWAKGPVATVEVESEFEGPGRLVIGYCNFEDGQRVRVLRDGEECGAAACGLTRRGGAQSVAFSVPVVKGSNRFDLAFWKWRAGPRPIAILVSSVMVIPAVVTRPHAAPVQR
ncbi:MAG: glycosyltransferase [Phycisphaerales bacterium]|nr:glycosyltransferase [Phycisphaerales bacterium]